MEIRPNLGSVRSALTLLLGSYAALSDAEATLIDANLGDARKHLANAEIRPDDSASDRPLVVTAGWACEAALLEDGRRQIVTLALPGDVLDLAEIRRRGLVATSLTAVRTRDLSRLVAALESTDSEGSQVARAWRLCRHAAETRLVRHIVRLGRLPAYERVADLLVDLHERQRRAGLADARTMNLPLTQEALADHLGLSIVHVNRTLQQLRRDRMIDYHAGRVVMRDAERLASIAAYRG